MNAFEKKVAKAYEQQGWTVMHTGWPDFLLVRKHPDGTLELKAAEVKSKKDKLRPNQRENMAALSTVMPVREVVEGPGFGDSLSRNDMHELIYDTERHGFDIYGGE